MSDNLKLADLAPILDQVDFSKIYDVEAEEKKQIGLWLTEPYKLRFDALQKASKKQFGDLLKRLIEMSIDRAEAAKPRAG